MSRKARLSKEEYINNVRKNIETKTSKSKEEIDKIVENLDVHNVAKLAKTGQYGYLLKYVYADNEELKYIESNPSLVRYYHPRGTAASAICVKNQDGTYNVAFSFTHITDCVIRGVGTKVCKVNYLMNRYRYNNINAKTSITAVCTAWNRNCSEFPGDRQLKRKSLYIEPNVYMEKFPCPVMVTECTWSNQSEEQKKMMYHTVNKYKIARQNLGEAGVDLDDIKYYTGLPRVNAMVVTMDGSRFVTFTFVSRKDYFLDMDMSTRKCITKTSLYNNFVNNKYTYKMDDAPNSLMAYVWGYNDHVAEFPNDFRRTKVKVELCVGRNEDVPF